MLNKLKIIILSIVGLAILSLLGLGLLGYFVEKQEIVQPEIAKSQK